MILRIAAFVLLLLGGFADAAAAWVPSPANDIVPPLIPVVGSDRYNGVPDSMGEFTVILRDLGNFPIANGLVVLDFSGCADLRLCADPRDPEAIVDCPTRTVRKFTSAAGTARFHVVGWNAGAPGSPGAPAWCARVYADGVLVRSCSVAIYDSNGGGLGPADLSAWLADCFGPYAPARDDYDGSGGLGPADLAQWLTVFYASGSTYNCIPPTVCP